jgi:hypothetical protein
LKPTGRWTRSYAKVLNFEKFEGVGLFRPTPPSPEPCYPLKCLEPGQNLTERKVRLITKKIVVE